MEKGQEQNGRIVANRKNLYKKDKLQLNRKEFGQEGRVCGKIEGLVAKWKDWWQIGWVDGKKEGLLAKGKGWWQNGRIGDKLEGLTANRMG